MIEDLTVREMRELLKGLGLPQYGAKAVLIERLVESGYQPSSEDEPAGSIYEEVEIDDSGDHVIPKVLRDVANQSGGKGNKTPELIARQTGEFMGFTHKAIIAPSLQQWGRAVTGDSSLEVSYSDADIESISTAWEIASLEYGWTAPVPAWGVLLIVEAAATVPIYMGIRQLGIQNGKWQPKKPKIGKWLKRLKFWKRQKPEEASGGRVNNKGDGNE